MAEEQVAGGMTQTRTAFAQADEQARDPIDICGLMRLVLIDPGLSVDDKKKLIDELRKGAGGTDRWTFRYAIWILGVVVILAVVAIGVLAWNTKTIPEGLVAIGSGAAGGLAGLLTPGRARDNAA